MNSKTVRNKKYGLLKRLLQCFFVSSEADIFEIVAELKSPSFAARIACFKIALVISMLCRLSRNIARRINTLSRWDEVCQRYRNINGKPLILRL